MVVKTTIWHQEGKRTIWHQHSKNGQFDTPGQLFVLTLCAKLSVVNCPVPNCPTIPIRLGLFKKKYGRWVIRLKA